MHSQIRTKNNSQGKKNTVVALQREGFLWACNTVKISAWAYRLIYKEKNTRIWQSAIITIHSNILRQKDVYSITFVCLK